MLLASLQLHLPAWVRDVADEGDIFPDAATRVALAIELSRLNVQHATGGPFGAAVFRADGALVAVGVNHVTAQNCSIAHAEIMALTLAQSRLERFRLNGTGERFALAASAQPCCQCYGAAVWAGIDELLIGARTTDVQELTSFDEGPLPHDWIGELTRRGISVRRDVLRESARTVLKQYGKSAMLRY